MAQTVAITDLAALAGMFGEERCAGRGEITAEIAGPLTTPKFTVDGVFDSLRVGAEARVRSVTAAPRRVSSGRALDRAAELAFGTACD